SGADDGGGGRAGQGAGGGARQAGAGQHVEGSAVKSLVVSEAQGGGHGPGYARRPASVYSWRVTLDLPAALLLDGGMGTGLIARGLDVRAEATAQWNLSRPDDVLDVHREHRAAGAGALHTNTFVANRLALAGLGIDVREANLAGARLAREAADGA